jgi:hypothetical protein
LSEKNKREAVQTPRGIWLMVWFWCLWFMLYVVPHRLYYRINYHDVAPHWLDNLHLLLMLSCSAPLLLAPLGYSLAHFLQSLSSHAPNRHIFQHLKPLLLIIFVFSVGMLISNHRYSRVDMEKIRGDNVILYRSHNFFCG